MPQAARSAAQRAVEAGEIAIQPATLFECVEVAAILCEAAAWLEQRGMPLWQASDFDQERLAADVASGQYMLARWRGSPAGVFRYQPEDPQIWPEAMPGEAAYVHRLAIRRRYAGSGLAVVLLHAAAARAGQAGYRYLRLDCDASRLRLQALYERCGFIYHSEHTIGPFRLARYQLVLVETTEPQPTHTS